MQDNLFAKALAAAWYVESKKANFSEVQQFRALMKSFASIKYRFKLEEFHGMKHHVIFNGAGSWGRPSARCEISDLLIVSYKNTPQFQARATLLQAKKSNEKHNTLCNYWPKSSAPTSFKANLEQWDLLSRRPNVLPFPPFDCHPDILSGAILPSVGSIGVFHKISGKNYNFFYMSADIATPLSSPRNKYAKLQIKNVNCLRNIQGYSERTFACCIVTFAKALFNLEIGTPIQNEQGLGAKDERYRNNFRGWLRTVLASHIEMTSPNSSLALDLMSQLESDLESDFMHNPPYIILVNCDEIEEGKRGQIFQIDK